MTDTVSLGMDADNAALVLRCLTVEFDRLVSSGRDARTDREIVALGVYCETLDRWLMEREAGVSSSELMSRLPLLEKPRTDSGLTDEEAVALVAFGATAWSDHWASSALDWVDQGVWGNGVAAALRLCADNKTFSQTTRHRAWAYVKSNRE